MWHWVQDARFRRAVVLDSTTLCDRGLITPGGGRAEGNPSIIVPLSPAYQPNDMATNIAPEKLIIDMTSEDHVHVL